MVQQTPKTSASEHFESSAQLWGKSRRLRWPQQQYGCKLLCCGYSEAIHWMKAFFFHTNTVVGYGWPLGLV